MNLYDEFIIIAKSLNKELDIIPVLYGSLGLEKVTGVKFSPQDIDILVPLTYLEEKWSLLKSAIEHLGYEVKKKGEKPSEIVRVNIWIDSIEDLKLFADVDHKNLKSK